MDSTRRAGSLVLWLACLTLLAQARPAHGQQPPPATQQLPEHPMLPVLRWAQGTHQALGQIKDYSCTFVKRELVDGELGEHQYMFAKVRHQPFSVYLYFLGPADLKGREVIYVEGRNDGHLLAHTTGLQDTIVGTLSLKPDSPRAMQGNRHPITRFGMRNLVGRMIELSEQAVQVNESEVRYFPGAKVNNRTCTCMQFSALRRRPGNEHYLRRLFVDDELKLPVRYESYGWPAQEGGQPPLLEEYTYMDLKLNNGFTDLDFDPRNSSYRFR
jgi:hypothetical protein